MALKATFLAGSDTATVKGLYQWDYGQELEIEATDIGSEIVEIHFASSNMSEAIVRSCAFSDGTGTVTVPDACLEHSSPITAWIYQIRGTQGHTIKTITLPVTARTRPSINRDIPATISDKYTELLTEINETVDALENGTVTVANAVNAQNAGHAASAGNAGTANFATTAGVAQYASSDTSKGTIEERLTAITDASLNDGFIVAQTWEQNQTAAKITLELDKVYAIAFNPKDDKGRSVILCMFGGDYVCTEYMSSLSVPSTTATGGTAMYAYYSRATGLLQIRDSNHNAVKVDMGAIYIREL